MPAGVQTDDDRDERSACDDGPTNSTSSILGGGPGGYAAALYGARAGMNIAMVEEQRVGGTCLHRGCIPAKELLQTAEVLRTVRGAAEFGVATVRRRRSTSPTTQTRKQEVVDRLTSRARDAAEGPQGHGRPGHRHARARRAHGPRLRRHRRSAAATC